MIVSEWQKGWQLWDLIGFLRDCGALASGLMYRGQANADWKLVPALYRRPVHIFGEFTKESLYLTAENRMINSFFDQALLLIPYFQRGEIVDRVIAQHYGVPTQLLDQTLDPFIALYFAVNEEARSDSDGALYYISPRRGKPARVKMNFPFQDAVTRVDPPVLDERVRLQKSVFTLQRFVGTDEFVPLDDRELKFSKDREGADSRDEVLNFGKVIIPKSRKRQIIGQLFSMGIDPSLVFPGLQGIGSRIAIIAQLNNYGGGGRF